MKGLLIALSLVSCGSETEKAGAAPELMDIGTLSSTDRPSPRSEVYGIGDPVTNSILVFGGNEGPVVNQRPTSIFVEETWIFEPGTGWTELAIDMPSARSRYGAAYDPTAGRALIFGGRYRVEGGSGDYDLFDELWSFDYESRTWTEIETADGPKTRRHHAPANVRRLYERVYGLRDPHGDRGHGSARLGIL